MKNLLTTIYDGIRKNLSRIPTIFQGFPPAELKQENPLNVLSELIARSKEENQPIQIKNDIEVKKGVTEMNPLSIFSNIEHWAQNFFVTAVKADKVFNIMVKDLPSTAPAMKDFWSKSLSLAAATSTTIDAKGLSIQADTAEWKAFTAWCTSFKTLAAKIEADANDAEAVIKATSNTQPALTGVGAASLASTIPAK